jgi:hypothetical protein
MKRKESSSYRGRKVVAGNNDSNGSDGADKWQSKRFKVVNNIISS